jgi:hypothetical protein
MKAAGHSVIKVARVTERPHLDVHEASNDCALALTSVSPSQAKHRVPSEQPQAHGQTPLPAVEGTCTVAMAGDAGRSTDSQLRAVLMRRFWRSFSEIISAPLHSSPPTRCPAQDSAMLWSNNSTVKHVYSASAKASPDKVPAGGIKAPGPACNDILNHQQQPSNQFAASLPTDPEPVAQPCSKRNGSCSADEIPAASSPVRHCDVSATASVRRCCVATVADSLVGPKTAPLDLYKPDSCAQIAASLEGSGLEGSGLGGSSTVSLPIPAHEAPMHHQNLLAAHALSSLHQSVAYPTGSENRVDCDMCKGAAPSHLKDASIRHATEQCRPQSSCHAVAALPILSTQSAAILRLDSDSQMLIFALPGTYPPQTAAVHWTQIGSTVATFPMAQGHDDGNMAQLIYTAFDKHRANGTILVVVLGDCRMRIADVEASAALVCSEHQLEDCTVRAS